jgi:hypothetical protein
MVPAAGIFRQHKVAPATLDARVYPGVQIDLQPYPVRRTL